MTASKDTGLYAGVGSMQIVVHSHQKCDQNHFRENNKYTHTRAKLWLIDIVEQVLCSIDKSVVS